MLLKVNLPFGTHRKGAVIDVPALQAQHLLAQRYLGRPLVERVAPVAAAAAPQPEPPPEPEHNPPPRRKQPRYQP